MKFTFVNEGDKPVKIMTRGAASGNAEQGEDNGVREQIVSAGASVSVGFGGLVEGVELREYTGDNGQLPDEVSA